MSNETSTGNPNPTMTFKLIGLLICFVLNFALLIFTTIKLVRRVKQSDITPQGNGQNRKMIFSLISIALLCRGLYEAYKIYCYLQVPQPPRNFNILTILDNLPTILLITLASSFSNYWHKRYSSFEGYDISVKKSAKYRAFLVLLNFIFYLIFAVLMWFTLHAKTAESASKMMTYIYGTFSADLLIVTLALWITGTKLLNRTTRFISYTGRTLKSANGFKCNFALLILCCLAKFAQQGIFFYSQLTHQIPFYLSDNFIFYNLFIVFFYIAGETGVFLCLIILLDVRATKCEMLLDKEDNSAKMGGSSTSEVSLMVSDTLSNPLNPSTPSTHL